MLATLEAVCEVLERALLDGRTDCRASERIPVESIGQG